MSVATTNKLELKRIKQGFIDRGESQAEFARKNALDYNILNMVLSGRTKGVRGEAHRCMVVLGLKKEVNNA